MPRERCYCGGRYAREDNPLCSGCMGTGWMIDWERKEAQDRGYDYAKSLREGGVFDPVPKIPGEIFDDDEMLAAFDEGKAMYAQEHQKEIEQEESNELHDYLKNGGR